MKIRHYLAASAAVAALVLTGPGTAAADGDGLSITGAAAPSSIADVTSVDLTVRNDSGSSAMLTELTAPAGFECDAADGIIAAGEETLLSCVGEYVGAGSAPFGVTGLIDGEPQESATTVDMPREEAEKALSVDVTADMTSVHPGEDVTYTIEVANLLADQTIHEVVVRSPDVRACDRDLGDMTPGEVVTYTCTEPAPDDTFRVRVRVRGYDSHGDRISRHDNDVTITIVPEQPSGSPSPSESSSGPSESAGPSGSESPGPSSAPATGPGSGSGSGSSLPVTGSAVATMVSIGGLLLAAGAGLWLLAHRRRARSEGEASR